MSGYVVFSIAAALLAIGSFWPSISSLFAKAKQAVPSIQGGDLISRDEAVAGLLRARDFAHAEGRHDTCHALEACLPGLVTDKDHATK